MNLAIEACLVQDIPSIFTPTEVGRMSSEQLAELAAEDEITQSRRALLAEEIEMLNDGLAQCRRYKPRALTGMFPAPSHRRMDLLGFGFDLSIALPSVNIDAKSPAVQKKPRNCVKLPSELSFRGPY